MPSSFSRRRFLGASVVGAAALATGLGADPTRRLFDGRSLTGWRALPRVTAPKALLDDPSIPRDALLERALAWARTHGGAKVAAHTGRWRVEDGVIVGGRDPVDSNLGCYLQSEETFGDFELELDAHPDWPADTGIMIRDHPVPTVGIQVLLDHRPNGGIGGVYGNSLGNFIAAPFYATGDELPGFKMGHLRPGVKPATAAVPVPMRHGARFEEFAKVWHPNDWNRFRIRCVGELPVVTTWINDLKICELDIASVHFHGYDPERTRRLIGPPGHIAFEVHDAGKMGHDRWAEGAVCRWRNIAVRRL